MDRQLLHLIAGCLIAAVILLRGRRIFVDLAWFLIATAVAGLVAFVVLHGVAP